MRKSPRYWQKGHPYLNGLAFESVPSDEAALEDLQVHDAQAHKSMTTPQLLGSYRSAGFTVTEDPGTSVIDLGIGEAIPPMNSLKAREALYYAVDAVATDKKLYGGTCSLDQSFTGPGGLFYDPRVPSYRSYDLAKAKALVEQLGRLSFTTNYLESGLGTEGATLVQTMLKAAGMSVKMSGWANLEAAIAGFNTRKWQVNLCDIGDHDPAGDAALNLFLQGHGSLSGTDDLIVNWCITKGESSPNPSVWATACKDLAGYLNEDPLMPFVCVPRAGRSHPRASALPGLRLPSAATSADRWSSSGRARRSATANLAIPTGARSFGAAPRR